MELKVRPVTVILLIVLLVVGVNTVLYHTGVFDSFLARKEKESVVSEGEGPVVRKEVTNLVLPLESSREAVAEAPDDGVIETDIPESEPSEEGKVDEVHQSVETAGTSSVADVAPETPVAAVPQEAPAVPVKPASAKAKPAGVQKTVPAKAPEAVAVKQKTVTSIGTAGLITSECAPGRIELKVPLSASSGRTTWFNLKSPRRLVIDINGKWKNKGRSVYRLKDCAVEKIVIGEHPDKMRLVIYLRGEKVPEKLSPVVEKYTGELKLSLNL